MKTLDQDGVYVHLWDREDQTQNHRENKETAASQTK